MTDPGAYVIETQNLTKKYNSFLVVDGLNLRIKRGEVFGFLGPNGAGKTTSIKMMVGLLKPTEGGVLIEGEEIESVEKGKIGVCPQDLVIWGGLTCEENIALIGDMYEVPRNVLKERIKQLLHDLILSDKTKTLASQLSGGMKRRLNLAMALIHEPEIVVLDEPSAGLDPQSRLVLWEYIHSLSKEKGKTIILTTHLMEEADRLSDRIAIMDHGKLLVFDTPESLKKKIGRGDVVEIQLSNPEMNDKVVSLMKSMGEIEEVKEIKGKVNVRALDAVSKLPGMLRSIEEMGISIVDTSIRRNTLEDVFIHLTGRGLRE
ncbi:MAG: multidrug ABC transporter ATP-binding protein [Desulfuromonadales bacterium C00003096]|nr:MAG: multidrug ABC transporter ATP-binding protein [Desulfuromonadales bacterium C00003096]